MALMGLRPLRAWAPLSRMAALSFHHPVFESEQQRTTVEGKWWWEDFQTKAWGLDLHFPQFTGPPGKVKNMGSGASLRFVFNHEDAPLSSLFIFVYLFIWLRWAFITAGRLLSSCGVLALECAGFSSWGICELAPWHVGS